MIEAVAIEHAEQIALIGVAKECLAPRYVGHGGDRIFGDPARPIAAAREPDRVDVGSVRHFDQRREAMPVLAREMAVDREALLVEDKLDVGIPKAGDRAHCLGIVGQYRRRGGDNTYAH